MLPRLLKVPYAIEIVARYNYLSDILGEGNLSTGGGMHLVTSDDVKPPARVYGIPHKNRKILFHWISRHVNTGYANLLILSTGRGAKAAVKDGRKDEVYTITVT